MGAVSAPTAVPAFRGWTPLPRVTHKARSLGHPGESKPRFAPDRNALLRPREAQRKRTRFGTTARWRAGCTRPSLSMCPENGQMCIAEMHHIDRIGGDEKNSEEMRSGSTMTIIVWKAARGPSGATFPASAAPPGPVQPHGISRADQDAAAAGSIIDIAARAQVRTRTASTEHGAFKWRLALNFERRPTCSRTLI